MNRNTIENIIDMSFPAFLSIALGSVVVGLVVWMIALFTTTGAVDYCYIEVTPTRLNPQNSYVLYGHRPWRPDHEMAISNEFNDVAAKAERIECKIKLKNLIGSLEHCILYRC